MFRPIFPLAFFRWTQEPSRNFELRPLLKPRGVTCYDSVSHNRVQVLNIPVLLLACSEDWTCNLQMIVSLEAQATNAYNHYAMCPAPIHSNQMVNLDVVSLFTKVPTDEKLAVVRDKLAADPLLEERTCIPINNLM